MASDAAQRRRYPISVHLAVFSLFTLLPISLVGTVIATRMAAQEQLRLEAQAQAFASDVSGDIDRELGGMIAALQALATSPALAAGDLATVYGQAKQVLTFRGYAIAMRDSSGQQILNTVAPWGKPLPVSQDETVRQTDRRVFETGKPAVSNLYQGAVTRQPFVFVDIPVPSGGEVRYAMNMAISPDLLRKVVLDATTPPDWNVSVIDGAMKIVARSREHERFIGSEASASFRENVAAGRTVWPGRTLDGSEVLTVAHQSALSGWRVAVSIPRRTLEAPMRQFLGGVAALTGLGLLGSLVLALAYGRTLAAPIRDVARAASALGTAKERQAPVKTSIAEVSAIANAMSETSGELRRRAEERDRALRSAEAGERRLRATYENAGAGIAEVDAHGRFVAVNETLCRITGYSREALLGMRFTDLSEPQDVAEDQSAFRGQLTGSQTDYVVEKRFHRRDGEPRWVRIFSTAVHEDGAFAYAVRVVLDVTDEKRASEHQLLLIAELNHRVKNTLAIVQSLVLQTLKSTPNPEHFKDALTGRVMALARSHDLLSDSDWKGTTLENVVRLTLAPHDGPDWRRTMIEGPAIHVGPRSVVSISLMINELATNAVKYGALSDQDGKLEVSWTLEGDGADQRVALRWSETTDRIQARDARNGFGSKLIRLCVEKELGGAYRQDFTVGQFRLAAALPASSLAH
ncbi:HWE histidine kinase domain-containing protein [Alsobacter sp. KACC 23698]|uniref:Blue-light-activated histidine kinase n=1 Tax=Alsobacter sp. KACC 23698 TaxID=3149229 RepID=A0AAU7JGK7_9HYPH